MTVRKHIIITPRSAAVLAVTAAVALLVALAPARAEACGPNADFVPANRMSSTGKGGTVSVKWAQSCTHADLNVYVVTGAASNPAVFIGTVTDGTRQTLDLPDQGMETSRLYTVYGESGDDRFTGFKMKTGRYGIDVLRPKTNEEWATNKLFFLSAEVLRLKNEYGLIGATRARIYVQNTSGVLGSATQMFPTGAVADDFRPAWRKAKLKTWVNGGKPSSIVMYFAPSENASPANIRVVAGAHR